MKRKGERVMYIVLRKCLLIAVGSVLGCGVAELGREGCVHVF